MRNESGILVALLIWAAICPRGAVASPPTESGKPVESNPPKAVESKPAATASLKIQVSAEGKSTLPSGSKIEWRGVDERCDAVVGQKSLETSGATPVSLPLCTVRFTIFVTGFDTKAVTFNLAAGAEKSSAPIRIAIKHQGPVEIDW